MKKEDIKKIIDLNNNFYQQTAKNFSQTRQYPWKGWERLLEQLPIKTRSILDIGSGNGRFYKFISHKYPNIEYTGLEINNDFINESKRKYPNARFLKLDIFKDISQIKETYDLVIAFGVTHHIPDENFRRKWFLNIANLVKSGGRLILSFWEFEKEPGDYFLGWGNKKEVKRFCHQYSKDEIKEIIDQYKKIDLELLDNFTDDNVNRYLVFGKI